MTGKFTQHIHDLGYATGRTLRHLFPYSSGSVIYDGSSLSTARSCLVEPFERYVIQNKNDGEYNIGILTPLKQLIRLLLSIPNRYRIWWIQLLHSDPLHVLVETLLIVMCIALVILQRRADWRFDQERKRYKPTKDEEEELINEWKMERRRPLGGISGGSIRQKETITEGGVGTGIVVMGMEGSRLLLQLGCTDDKQLAKIQTNGDVDSSSNEPQTSLSMTTTTTMTTISAINFATLDCLASSSSPSLRKVARNALSHYGCGSCGPRGFYGTIDAHLEVETAMSSFLGTEGAILYSDGASAATSTIAAFAKRGDLLIVDEGVNEALLVGVTLSRANVRYFRHNNMRDLRKVLEKIKAHDETCHRHSADQRRFLIVEGLYRNWGTIAPLDEIVKLKEEFCYRLILDDTHGMGVLGTTGRGTLERFGLRPMIHAEIVTFSLEYSLGSVGGMTVGCEEVVDHQRLSGAGYCFSASAPPFLSKVCLASIRRIEGRLDDLMIDNENDEDRNDDDEDRNDDDELSSFIPHSPAVDTVAEDLSGPALLERLHENVSTLYGMLTNSSHPYALKLHNRLVITSHPQSPILYLRLANDEAIGRTRNEQTGILDQISRYCLLTGHVAIVSTGGHVKKSLQLVPEPCLRLVTNVGQTNDDFEVLVKALGSAVESILVCNDDILE